MNRHATPGSEDPPAPREDLASLTAQARRLEERIEHALEARRQALQLRIVKGRVIFEQSLAERHRRLRTGLLRFLAASPLKYYLTAPVIYSLIIPIALLDAFVSVYQAICFRAWGIARARRGEYIAFDRHQLAYLNGIQKLNCTYCAYANGVIAFAREVAARTEQFWCPIKHAVRVRGVHERYPDFLDFGDGDGFVARSEDFRARLKAGG